ncbi:rod shape-determining protein MreD [Brevibacillus humidisoli]|uniref:rod shape-determining protein MreD n=1 Tax=Brevibacillus humidisoli TaxID=2895522 RepID=UPI001E3B9B7D|nr:rod shape-determining protein MreD [Brevibacillus humidisoli]UFJ39054.1 rod shape-determining protein MreD [Brevibacillus humidisoli]
MPRLILTLTLLVLFLLEGTVLQLLLPDTWGLTWEAVPRFVLVGVVLIGLFLNRRESLIYGMVFGFLHDVLYNQIIGVHTLTMMVAGYFAGLALLLFHRSLAVAFVTLTLVLFGHEWLLYSLYRLFFPIDVDVQWMLRQQILPTVGLNLLFAVLIYFPLSKIAAGVNAKKEMKLD